MNAGDNKSNTVLSKKVEALLSKQPHKKTAEDLRESEEKYRNLFNNFLDSVAVHQIILDEQGIPVDYIFLQANAAFESQTGLSVANILGKRVTEVIPDIKKTPLIEIYGKVTLTGEPVTFEQIFEPFGRHFRINAFKVGEGRFCTVFRDITEQRQAEDKLRLKNTVFDASIAANSIADLDGIITEVNDAFLRQWVYSSREEVTGKYILDFMNDPNDGLAIIAALNKKDEWEGDFTAKKKDGTIYFAHGLATTIKDTFGHVMGYQSSVIDITDRIQSEIKIKDSESKFRSLVWDMQVGVIVQGPQAEIILCNPKSSELLGLSEDQLLGKTSFDPEWNVIHEDGSPFPASTLPVPRAISDRRSIREVVMGVYRPDKGDRVWLLVSAEPQLNDEGQVKQVVCTFVDISERKLAEEALFESERKFRDTITFLDEGYYSATLDGILLDHNQAFYRILGFDAAVDLKGIQLSDFWEHPDLRKQYLDTILANGSVSNYQINILTKNGEKKTTLVSSHVVNDKDNGSLRMEGVFLDITERIRIEESLCRQTERLQNLRKIDKAILSPLGSSEAIIQKSLQHIRSLLSSQHASIGIIDFENEALQLFAANISNGSIEKISEVMLSKAFGDLEILRQKRMEVVEDISMKSSPPELLQILQSDGIMSCINIPLISGEKLIGAMNLGWQDPRAFTDEEIEIASEVADEITIAIEQVRLREEAKHYTEEMERMVEERTAQLQAANKELEAFSYSVSHDLRAPLRHINGYVDLLIRKFHNSISVKEKHYLDTIADSAHQMGMLIDDLLQFSRTSRQEMIQADLDMNIVLHDALNSIKKDTQGRNITWDIAVLPHATGDFALIRQVWINLLSNAVKFTRKNLETRIAVGFADNDNEFIFFVHDNGVGFDMQYVHKLFGVFQRLHSSEEFEGNGIGLANVSRIILKHGGRTWAESQLGKGAVFYFSLPKKPNGEI